MYKISNSTFDISLEKRHLKNHMATTHHHNDTIDDSQDSNDIINKRKIPQTSFHLRTVKPEKNPRRAHPQEESRRLRPFSTETLYKSSL